MTFSASTYFVALCLLLIQLLAALPWGWLVFASGRKIEGSPWLLDLFVGRSSLPRLLLSAQGFLPRFLGVLLVVFAAPLAFILIVTESGTLMTIGYFYGVILQVQLLADAFILLFAGLLYVWPKGAAIALSAFREGVRQPMFWLLFGVAFLAMTVSPLIPYFTFGEDHLVVREIGYDTIMLFAAIFGALAASISISEEIEGRTAVTLMSKPVSRRHFLIGKFLGIVLAAGVLFALLGTYFEGISLFKHWWDKMDPEPTPVWLTNTLEAWALPGVTTDLLRGIGLWTHLTLDVAPGLILGFSQVMVLVAIAVSLATRVPMVVNLIVVVVIFFLAHLAPVLVSVGYAAQKADPGAAVSQILFFMARLFDLVLPNLESFRLEPALLNDLDLREKAPDFTAYLASVSLYGVLYTTIVLLFGLILFEDRDLA
ncbi:MAG TPA: ABC transporter permease subunit [Gemmataceae bacterium]|nr:ABC transporter permease subunit [Gemmataceae bacterium]